MSIFTSNIPLIVNNISTMKDVSAQNMDLSGSLDVSGNTTIGGALQANGGITCDTDKFVVEDATGNTSIGGTLNVETSLTTNQLIVNDDLYFDTIVLRRPTGETGVTDEYAITLYELQCWVNDTNTLYDNSSNLVTYFAYWTDKEDEVAPSIAPSSLYDNDTSESGRIGSYSESRDDLAVIIKNVPKTTIHQIQSLVLYNRTHNQNLQNLAIGLAIELYNIDNDPDLETPLASTNVITTAEDVFRYDFPAIDTYPSGDFSDTDSITQIASETLALKEVVSEFADSANITGGLKVDTITTTGNVDISGGLTCDTITTTGNVDITGNLTSNLLTTKQLNVDNSEYFDTIVIRRPTGETGVTDEYGITLYELQCWVNDTNTLYNNSSNLVTYFAYWTDKEDEVAPSMAPSSLHDNDISESGRIGSFPESRDDLVVIIKNVPKTTIQQIQSLVLYNRTNSSYNNNRAIGLAIELYNIDNDPNLETPLKSTNVITTAEDVYRFDFPAIDTYTGYFLIRIPPRILRVKILR